MDLVVGALEVDLKQEKEKQFGRPVVVGAWLGNELSENCLTGHDLDLARGLDCGSF